MPLRLTREQLKRYGRQIALPELGEKGQAKLLASKVLIIGAGGLGSPAALYLAACGVGRIGLVDSDEVELSNLQRQILHSTKDIGAPKVDSGKKKLRDLNPDVEVSTYNTRLTADNILDVIKDYDIILDCSDNFPTKYLINDACVLSGKPFIHAGIFKFKGQAMTVIPHKGPCYRCLFPELPPAEFSTTQGPMGVVPGVIGTIQANEAIKYLTGIGDLLVGRLLIFDALKNSFRTTDFRRDRSCPVCGAQPRITNLKGDSL